MTISNWKKSKEWGNGMKCPIIKRYLTEATGNHYSKIGNAKVILKEVMCEGAW